MKLYANKTVRLTLVLVLVLVALASVALGIIALTTPDITSPEVVDPCIRATELFMDDYNEFDLSWDEAYDLCLNVQDKEARDAADS